MLNRKKEIALERIHSILLVRTHIVSVQDAIKIVVNLKKHFPCAKIVFAGNAKNLIAAEISSLRNSFYIDDLLIYNDDKTGKVQYIQQIRGAKFNMVVIPFIPQPRGFYRKTKILALVSGTRNILLYDMGTDKLFKMENVKNMIKNVTINLFSQILRRNQIGKKAFKNSIVMLLRFSKNEWHDFRTLFIREKNLKNLYNVYWKNYFSFSSSFEEHCRVDWCLDSGLSFNSALEIGVGNGDGLIKLLKAGKKARGIEYSHYLFENLLKYKFPNGEVLEGDIANLPFRDNSFDMVCSFDVLEHLPKRKVELAIKEIYRVTNKYFYGSISEKIDFNKKFHLTVKPYKWWRNKFLAVGFKDVETDRMGLHAYEK
ncbi:MAG: class I SAM-dependent methyltransferase [Candidatus Omnitrophota bacterium]